MTLYELDLIHSAYREKHHKKYNEDKSIMQRLIDNGYAVEGMSHDELVKLWSNELWETANDRI